MSQTDFDAVFAALRAVMASSSSGYMVTADEPGNYSLNSTKVYRGKPLFAGAVRSARSLMIKRPNFQVYQVSARLEPLVWSGPFRRV